jgi:hypothetical protein
MVTLGNSEGKGKRFLKADKTKDVGEGKDVVRNRALKELSRSG